MLLSDKAGYTAQARTPILAKRTSHRVLTCLCAINPAYQSAPPSFLYRDSFTGHIQVKKKFTSSDVPKRFPTIRLTQYQWVEVSLQPVATYLTQCVRAIGILISSKVRSNTKTTGWHLVTASDSTGEGNPFNWQRVSVVEICTFMIWVYP